MRPSDTHAGASSPFHLQEHRPAVDTAVQRTLEKGKPATSVHAHSSITKDSIATTKQVKSLTTLLPLKRDEVDASASYEEQQSHYGRANSANSDVTTKRIKLGSQTPLQRTFNVARKSQLERTVLENANSAFQYQHYRLRAINDTSTMNHQRLAQERNVFDEAFSKHLELQKIEDIKRSGCISPSLISATKTTDDGIDKVEMPFLRPTLNRASQATLPYPNRMNSVLAKGFLAQYNPTSGNGNFYPWGSTQGNEFHILTAADHPHPAKNAIQLAQDSLSPAVLRQDGYIYASSEIHNEHVKYSKQPMGKLLTS